MKGAAGFLGRALVQQLQHSRFSGNVRLIIGTGKYKSFEKNAAAVEASGAEIVTVAVRQVNISDPKQPLLMDHIDPKMS